MTSDMHLHHPFVILTVGMITNPTQTPLLYREVGAGKYLSISSLSSRIQRYEYASTDQFRVPAIDLISIRRAGLQV